MLLDIGLPEMNGYEVAKKLKSDPASTDIRLIALTGYGQSADKMHAAAAGFDAFLVKPVRLPDLAALLSASGNSTTSI